MNIYINFFDYLFINLYFILYSESFLFRMFIVLLISSHLISVISLKKLLLLEIPSRNKFVIIIIRLLVAQIWWLLCIYASKYSFWYVLLSLLIFARLFINVLNHLTWYINGVGVFLGLEVWQKKYLFKMMFFWYFLSIINCVMQLQIQKFDDFSLCFCTITYKDINTKLVSSINVSSSYSCSYILLFYYLTCWCLYVSDAPYSHHLMWALMCTRKWCIEL